MWLEWLDAIPLIIGEEWSKDHDRHELMRASNYWKEHDNIEKANKIRKIALLKYT